MNRFVSFDTIECIANVASIFTAIVAGGVACWYYVAGHQRMRKLEGYLKAEKESSINLREDRGQRSLLNVMARVGLTEEEALQASFRSRYIKRLLAAHAPTHLATDILFEYDPMGRSQ